MQSNIFSAPPERWGEGKKRCPAHKCTPTVLKITSRDQGSELSSATMIPQWQSIPEISDFHDFELDACHRSQAPNFCTLQLSLAYQTLVILSLMQLKKDL